MAPGRISRAQECPPGRARSWRREEDVRGRRGDGEGVRPRGFGGIRVRRSAKHQSPHAQPRSLGRPSCDHNHLEFATPSHPELFSKVLTARNFDFGRWARPLGGCWRGGPPPPRPDGGWPPDPRPPPLPRTCRGRRVVRCSALRSWLEELRSLPRSSVVARRRARDELATMAAAPAAAAAAAAAASRHRDGAGSGAAAAPLGSPAGGVRGNSVARDLSQRYVCLANRAAAESARPTPPRRPQWRRRRRRRPPRAPLPPGRAAPARAAGRLAPACLRPARGPARAAARNFCARHRATPPLRAPAGRR